MSIRTLVELNHDHCPDIGDKTAMLVWARFMADYMRLGKKEYLPRGVTFVSRRHHSEPEPASTWQPVNGFAPKDGTKVDLWLHIRATPRSFGMSDSFRVTDCWWNAGSWKHRDGKGQVEDLITSYVTHYMPCPAPPVFGRGG